MRALLQDLRYALRSVAKSPGFVVVAVLTLAVGIGAATSMFTLLDQVVLRPLPVREPHRLAQLRWDGAWMGNNHGDAAWSIPAYEELQKLGEEVFEEVFARHDQPASLGYAGESASVITLIFVTGNYFQGLGVTPELGRMIQPDDDVHIGGHPVVVLAHDFWAERFGADPKIVGKTIQLNSHDFEVIGVSARGFRGVEFHNTAYAFVPMSMKEALSTGYQKGNTLTTRIGRWANVFARLRDDVSLEQAQAALAPSFAQLVDAEAQIGFRATMSEFARNRFKEAKLLVEPGYQGPRRVREQLETPLMLMLGMSGLLLAIACANVANLLIARAAARQREVAVRLALGVGRARLLRQLLAESLLVAAGAAALGLLVAQWSTRLLLSIMPGAADNSQLTASIDLRVLLFAVVVTTATAILFGLAPALQAMRVQVADTLKAQGGSIAGGNFGVRKALVVGQICLSLVLLAGAGLFIHTLLNLSRADTGYDLDRVLTFRIDPAQTGYDLPRQRALLEQVRTRLGSLPSVEEVGVSLVRVLDGNEWDSSVTVVGYEKSEGENTNVHFNAISPGYFGAMGVPILEGRDIEPGDVEGAQRVIIVNQKFADYFFEGRSPVGRKMYMGNPDEDPVYEIVGLIPNVRYEDIREEIPRQMFVAYDQRGQSSADIFLRSSDDPEALVAAVTQTMRDIDPMLPVTSMRTMDEQLAQALTSERLVAFLAGAFGLAATGLCAVGLYSVLAYSVTRRTKEIGLRLALGAQPGDVRRLVAGEGLRLFAVAAAVALPAAYSIAKLAESQLFGIEPYDPLTLAAATMLLGVIAWMAGYGPARRAARTEPMQALRFE